MEYKVATLVSREPTIPQLLGPFLLGLLVNNVFWGIQITQTYYYYRNFRKTDRTWVKVAVAILFIADLVESIGPSRVVWQIAINDWGDLSAAEGVPDWGHILIPLAVGLTVSIVHAFYAQKIWVLLEEPYNYICTAIVLSLSCLQLTAGIGHSVLVGAAHLNLSKFDHVKKWFSIRLVSASVTDLIITALMTWKLSRSRTGFQKTDDIISKLIWITVETGLTTAIVQIVDFVVFIIWPLTPYHATPTFIAPKVYSNSMLALLNSREPKKFDTQTGASFDNSIRMGQSTTIAREGYELGTIDSEDQKIDGSAPFDLNKDP